MPYRSCHFDPDPDELLHNCRLRQMDGEKYFVSFLICCLVSGRWRTTWTDSRHMTEIQSASLGQIPKREAEGNIYISKTELTGRYFDVALNLQALRGISTQPAATQPSANSSLGRDWLHSNLYKWWIPLQKKGKKKCQGLVDWKNKKCPGINYVIRNVISCNIRGMESAVQTWWCFQGLPRWSTHSAGCAHMEKDSQETGFGQRALPWWFHRTRLGTTAINIGKFENKREKKQQHKLAQKTKATKQKGGVPKKVHHICSLRQLLWIIETVFTRSDTTRFVILFAVTWKEKGKLIQYAVCFNILDTAAKKSWRPCWQILQSKVETLLRCSDRRGMNTEEYCNIKQEEECQIYIENVFVFLVSHFKNRDVTLSSMLQYHRDKYMQ